MKNTFKISLKPNEKIYINGAVVKVDRKVSIEFLNDVQFLLENHVMQPEQATTPLRQLYFIAQIVLMTPGAAQDARAMFRKSLTLLLANFEDSRILAGLKEVDRLVVEDQVYDALKAIRALYAVESAILSAAAAAPPPPQQQTFATAGARR